MRFWDTSALIPLMLDEPETGRMRRLLTEDGSIVTASITPIEIASVLWRRRHAGRLPVAAHHDADAMFAELSARWNEVAQTSATVQAALDVVTRHPLRTLDAIQLAAAIVVSDQPSRLAFVTLDRNLAAAARAEGFPVVP
jgi:predicted nucleic acid-binding protein